MAHKTPDGCWRVSVRVKGRRVTKKFPEGVSKKSVDDFERNVKLGKIDPSLIQQSVVPFFRDFFATWIVEVGIEWTTGFVRKRQQEFRDHLEPVLGSLRLNDIDAKEVRSLQLKLLAKKTARGDKALAPQTVNKIVSTVNVLLFDARPTPTFLGVRRVRLR